ncbi:hypothetical protein RM549_06160 [Salegentibacter sp. F188]|uniref:Uncharacterized protein n=1 Tax=Autumnicola patrickiae TaxID=3075591 RepID=A0ABU3E071_9FLAO|nr:hypothetical protein [Salegentibacter sp. F188]MDT0689361.1 hypothetical protein [Salegentibacter sp. F188]
MERIVNQFRSLFEVSSERLRNPLLFSFFISLLIINWKSVLILLFSESSIEKRIFFVEDNYLNIYTSLVVPLLIALVYTFLQDLFMRIVEKVTYREINKRREIKNQHLLDKIGRKFERDKKELKFENQKSELLREQNINLQIDNYKKEISNLQEKNAQLNKRNEEHLKKIEEAQKENARLFSIANNAEWKNLFENGEEFHGQFALIINHKNKIGTNDILAELSSYIEKETNGTIEYTGWDPLENKGGFMVNYKFKGDRDRNEVQELINIYLESNNFKLPNSVRKNG